MIPDSRTTPYEESKYSRADQINSPPRTKPSKTAKRKPKPPKKSQAEKRIDYLLKLYFDAEPSSRKLILTLAKYDPTPKKKYLGWLVKHFIGGWVPPKTQLLNISQRLKIHHKGAKYFSPLTWTGLRLEEAGYHADIFKYTPRTILKIGRSISEIIQTDEEDKQIRKGNLVVTAGAELAYKDHKWTLLRIRNRKALERLGQGTAWCVCNGRLNGYRLPFDFLLNSDGERFLANGNRVLDRNNQDPPPKVRSEIERVRLLSGDGYDRAKAHVNFANKEKKRLEPEIESLIMQHPDHAIRYAARVIGGKWEEFEKHVQVATLSAAHATEYAIRCRRERWPRFENKIKRCKSVLQRYREAFPGSIPKTEEEVFQEGLEEWRRHTPLAKEPVQHWSIGWQAESRERNIDFEDQMLLNMSRSSIVRYAKLVASLATSSIGNAYIEKIRSYFEETTDEKTTMVNDRLAPIILEKMQRRFAEFEPRMTEDPVNDFPNRLERGVKYFPG